MRKDSAHSQAWKQKAKTRKKNGKMRNPVLYNFV